MKNFKSISLVFGLMILSACGSQSSRNLPLSSTSSNSSTAYPTPTPGGNVNNLPAAQQQRIQLSGNNGGAFSQTVRVYTDHTLRVKVEALSAPNLTLAGYTNWVFAYGCMRVSVTVNGSTRSSKILKVAGKAGPECLNSPSSEIIDFSDVMTGSGTVNVTFSNAEYDNCRYYSNPSAYGCGMQAVWQNHQAAVNATIQVDGRYME